MPTLEQNRVLWLTFLGIVVLILLIGAYLGYLQAQGIPQQVTTDETPASDEVVLEGEYGCLPHADGTKATECTPGLKTADDEYYGLDMGFILDASSTPELKNGMHILAGGTLASGGDINAEQWGAYPIKAVMRVEEIGTQEAE